MKYGDIHNARDCPEATKWLRMVPVNMQASDQVIEQNLLHEGKRFYTPKGIILGQFVESGQARPLYITAFSTFHAPPLVCSVRARGRNLA